MVDTEDPLLPSFGHGPSGRNYFHGSILASKKKVSVQKITNRIGVYSGERNLNGRMYVDLVLF